MVLGHGVFYGFPHFITVNDGAIMKQRVKYFFDYFMYLQLISSDLDSVFMDVVSCPRWLSSKTGSNYTMNDLLSVASASLTILFLSSLKMKNAD